MLEELKNLLRHTTVYGMGNVLGKAVGFIMIPFYTHYLTTADYGTLELLDLSLALTVLILTMWMNTAVIRHYNDYDDQRERNEVISTMLLLGMAIGLVVTAGGIYFSRTLAQVILSAPELHYYVAVISVTFSISCLNAVCWSYLRAQQRSLLVVSLDTVSLVLTLSLNIYLIAVRHLGVLGVLYSSLIANSIIAAVIVSRTIWEVKLSFSPAKMKAVVKFGAPLVLTSLAAFMVNFSDRFFLRRFSTISTVGIYALGYKFGFMLSFLVVQPFDTAWGARIYDIEKDGQAPEIFPKVLEYYCLILVAVALGLSVVIKDVIHVIATPAFYSAYKVVPIVALAYIFQGLNRFFLAGTYIGKKTIYMGPIGGIAAALNLVLNYLMIPRFGMLGAAWATALSFCFMATLAYMVSQKVYHIPYSFSRVAWLFGLAAGFYVVSLWLDASSWFLSVGLRVALLLLFPVTLYLVGFFEKKELDKAKELLHVVMQRWGVRTAAAVSGR